MGQLFKIRAHCTFTDSENLAQKPKCFYIELGGKVLVAEGQ